MENKVWLRRMNWIPRGLPRGVIKISFIYFLDKNNYLYRKTGEKKINDNALIALSLLTAISEPKDKNVLIKIITNLISE